MQYRIRNVELKDVNPILEFSDKCIGKNYFQKSELRQILLRGQVENLNASLVAVDHDDNIIGVRLTMAPEEWHEDENYSAFIQPHKWKVPTNQVAYLKIIFVSKKFQNLGIEKELSERSIEILKKMGAKAIICHSSLERFKSSSKEYLLGMKYQTIATHQLFWFYKNYQCSECTPLQCSCQTEEMIKYLS